MLGLEVDKKRLAAPVFSLVLLVSCVSVEIYFAAALGFRKLPSHF
jgi:hypothetical protein